MSECIVKAALAEARKWIDIGSRMDGEIGWDHRFALAEWMHNTRYPTILAKICRRLSDQWASGARDGFRLLDTLVSMIGQEMETCDGERVRVEGFHAPNPLTGRGWQVELRWLNQQAWTTLEPANRLVDLGLVTS
jgi:hypothetical protein